MTKAPVLALPYFTQAFVLETDACTYGIGVVPMQSGRPISFFNKTIGPKVAAMSTYDKEALASIYGLKHWKHDIAAASLIIRIHQQTLKYIQEQKLTEVMQYKLSEDATFIRKVFPTFQPSGQVWCHSGGVIRT